MTIAVPTPSDLSRDDIAFIVHEVWDAVLRMPLTTAQERGASDPDRGPTAVGWSHVSGSWNGSVLVECDAPVARAAAAVMFDSSPRSLSQAEIDDALGELTNMISGSVKRLLPGPNQMTLPRVSPGNADIPGISGIPLAGHVQFLCDAGQLTVSVWQSRPPAAAGV